MQSTNVLGFTGFTLQGITWPNVPSCPVTLYLWGGGGGGGSGTSFESGGTGTGGSYAQVSFTINSGDTLIIAVGEGGAGGAAQGAASQGGRGVNLGGSQQFSGGNGGGWSNNRGGGGSGGAATVAILNGSVIGVAAGGGGGGGAGYDPTTTTNLPRSGFSSFANGSSGQDGQTAGSNQGSGGGGGGGVLGGNGGWSQGGRLGGTAGNYGTSLGSVTVNGGINGDPGLDDSPFYLDKWARGGGGTSSPFKPGTAGGSGTAVVVFEDISQLFVHNGISFQPVSQTWIRQQNQWVPVSSINIRTGDLWQTTFGGSPPEFSPSSFAPYQRVSRIFSNDTPCISVIDETSASSSTIQNDWNNFRSSWPSRNFFLLQPGGPGQGNLQVPANFTSDPRAQGPFAVNRDNGNPASASDWFGICGLGALSTYNQVALSIDNSGSMTTATVQASYNLFKANCAANNIRVIEVTMSGERWAPPFNRVLSQNSPV